MTMLRELVDDGYRLEVLDEHTDTSDTVETAPEELGRLLAGLNIARSIPW